MSTITKRLSVDQYDQMVENGILPETNRFELIEGNLVEKMTKRPSHSVVTGLCLDAIEAVLPSGWHTRVEQPVRIPSRDSEPEPDVTVARGKRTDFLDRHPGPEDVALVVEVTGSSVAKDRALARTYGGGGIPAYWIVNVPRRRIEVYEGPGPKQGRVGRYQAPKILGATESVDLIIDGQVVGRIAVAELLPRAEGGGK
jgi:Uma2 family endonuclease